MSTDLYRHFGPSGELLYVGISLDWPARTQQHKEASDWFDQIRTMTIEKFATREAALLAEAKVIREEMPIHNIQHNKKAATREELEAKERAKVIYDSAYSPVCWSSGNIFSVKWRDFLGHKWDRDFASESEALTFMGKLVDFKTGERQSDEFLREALHNG